MPGDIIQSEAGDNIPADARLIQSFSLSVQEAALTGASVPTDKDAVVVLTVTSQTDAITITTATNMNTGGTQIAIKATSAPTDPRQPLSSWEPHSHDDKSARDHSRVGTSFCFRWSWLEL